MARVQFRRDTAANWSLYNPILADGEIGIDKDTNQFKLGNGLSAWDDLEYSTSAGLSNTTEVPVVDMVASANELSTVTITISNYDASTIYSVHTTIGTVNMTSHPYQLILPEVPVDTDAEIYILATKFGKATSAISKTIRVLNVGTVADTTFSFVPANKQVNSYIKQDNGQANWNKVTINAITTEPELKAYNSIATSIALHGNVSNKLIGVKSDNSLVEIEHSATKAIMFEDTNHVFETLTTFTDSVDGSFAFDAGNGKVIIVTYLEANAARVSVFDKTTRTQDFTDTYYGLRLELHTQKMKQCTYANGYLVLSTYNKSYNTSQDASGSFITVDVFNRKVVGNVSLYLGSNGSIGHYHFDGKNIVACTPYHTSTVSSFLLINPFHFGNRSSATVVADTYGKIVLLLGGMPLFLYGNTSALTFKLGSVSSVLTGFTIPNVTLPTGSGPIIDNNAFTLKNTFDEVIIKGSNYLYKFKSKLGDKELTDIALVNNPELIEFTYATLNSASVTGYYDADTDLIYIFDSTDKTVYVYLCSNMSLLGSYNISNLGANTLYGNMWVDSEGFINGIGTNASDQAISYRTDKVGKRFATTTIDLTPYALSTPLKKVINNPIDRFNLNYSSSQESYSGYIKSYNAFTGIINRKGLDINNLYAVSTTGIKEKLNVISSSITTIAGNSALTGGTTATGVSAYNSEIIEMPNGSLYNCGYISSYSFQVAKYTAGDVSITPTKYTVASSSTYAFNGTSACKITDDKILIINSTTDFGKFYYSVFNTTTNTFTTPFEVVVHASSNTLNTVYVWFDGYNPYILAVPSTTSKKNAICYKLTEDGLNILESKRLDITLDRHNSYINKAENINGETYLYNGNYIAKYNYRTNTIKDGLEYSPLGYSASLVFYIDRDGNTYMYTLASGSSYILKLYKHDRNNKLVYEYSVINHGSNPFSVGSVSYVNGGYITMTISGATMGQNSHLLKENSDGTAIEFMASTSTTIQLSGKRSMYLQSEDKILNINGMTIHTYDVYKAGAGYYKEFVTLTYDTPSITIDHLEQGTNSKLTESVSGVTEALGVHEVTYASPIVDVGRIEIDVATRNNVAQFNIGTEV